MAISITLTSYEQQLLDSWEEVAKRGQLTIWIMLALKDGDKHMAEIKNFISRYAHPGLVGDDQSMYRALRRYHEAELVSFTVEPGDGGGERKVYRLTPIGRHVLGAYTKRNIEELFYQPDIRSLIERKL